jgi:hypothetical protein
MSVPSDKKYREHLRKMFRDLERLPDKKAIESFEQTSVSPPAVVAETLYEEIPPLPEVRSPVSSQVSPFWKWLAIASTCLCAFLSAIMLDQRLFDDKPIVDKNPVAETPRVQAPVREPAQIQTQVQPALPAPPSPIAKPVPKPPPLPQQKSVVKKKTSGNQRKLASKTRAKKKSTKTLVKGPGL